jgi:uncharacterized protein YdcH (DUF465 family)
MTADELIRQLEAAQTEQDRQRVLRQINPAKLSEQDRQRVVTHFLQSSQVSIAASLGAIFSDERSRVTTNRTVRDAVAAPDSPGGQAVTPEERAAAEEAGVTLAPTNVPREILDLVGIPDVDKKTAEELLNTLNEVGGYNFSSLDELVRAGVHKGRMVQQIAAAILPEPGPRQDVSVSLPSGGRYTVPASEWKVMEETLGYDSDALVRVARYADLANVRNAKGEVAPAPLAALLSAAGFGAREDTPRQARDRDLLGQQATLDKQIRELRGQLEAGKFRTAGQGEANAASDRLRKLQEQRAQISNQLQANLPASRDLQGQRADLDRRISQLESGPQTAGTRSQVSQLKRERAQLDSQIAANPVSSGMVRANAPFGLAQKFAEGLQRHDFDPNMAYLYALDPALAGRIQAANGDPAKITQQDFQLVRRLQHNGGWDKIVEMGYVEADSMDSIAQFLMDAALRAASGGGGGRKRVFNDPEAIRQSAKQLYKSMYLEDPSEEQLAKFTSMVTQIERNSPEDQNVDIGAQVRRVVQDDERYKEYYGNMPGGMVEEEYQGMMRAGQESVLGEEAAGNAAVRLGMRSGQYQTSVGAAVGTQEAWDNSTWLGRLARVAQVTSANT